MNGDLFPADEVLSFPGAAHSLGIQLTDPEDDAMKQESQPQLIAPQQTHTQQSRPVISHESSAITLNNQEGSTAMNSDPEDIPQTGTVATEPGNSSLSDNLSPSIVLPPIKGDLVPSSSSNTITTLSSSNGASNTVKTTKSGLRLNTFDPSTVTASHIPSVVNIHSSAVASTTPVSIGTTSVAPALQHMGSSSTTARYTTAATPVTSAAYALPNRVPMDIQQSLPISITRNRNNSVSNYNRFDDDNLSIVSASSLATSLSKNFLFGFLNNKQKDGNKKNGLISKEYWMKDETSTECFICGSLFTTFRRKHHCRICGQIFCNKCTLLIPGDKFNYNGKMRVCKNCFNFATDYNEDTSDDSSIDDTHSHYDNEPAQPQDFDVGTPKSQHMIHADSFNLPSHFALMNSSVSKFGSNNAPHDHHSHGHSHGHRHTHSFSQYNESSGKPFVPTPPTPPPRMAIPTTRNGESVEIPSMGPKSFSQRVSVLHNSNGGGGSNNVMGGGNARRTFEKQFQQHQHNHNYNHSHNHSQSQTPQQGKYQVGSGSQQLAQFFRGLDPTISNSNMSEPNLTRNLTDTSIDNHHQTSISLKDASNGASNEEAVLESPVAADAKNDSNPYDSGSEDEGSMSLYAALHFDHPHQSSDYKPTQSPHDSGRRPRDRRDTKSVERAQASLIRMKNRRKSKSKGNAGNILNYEANILNGSPIQGGNAVLDSGQGLSVGNVSFADGSLDPLDAPHGFNISPTKPVNASSHSRALGSNLAAVKQSKVKSELSDVCITHVRNILHQDLLLEGIDSPERWESIILPLLTHVEDIEYDVKSGDNFDVRQYVKLKRLQGGAPEDTQIVDGIVFCKTLALKGMPKELINPRIVLIMFPIEYVRSGQQHFMSLEPVLAQENEFINKLVQRIIALQPDAVFVGAPVSGIALRLLYEAGIVVSYNVKPQVMERIARLTQSDIVISMDKLARNIKLGTCSKLEVKTYAYGNRTKTLISLTGCDLRFGFTLLMRGGDNVLLRKIKESVEFMVYTSGHLKNETAFYHDNFIYSSPNAYKKMLEDSKRELESDEMFGIEFLREFRGRLLSISPIVKFDSPYLLIKARYFQKLVDEAKLDFARIESEPDVLKHYMSQIDLRIEDLGGGESEAKKIAKCMLTKRVSLLEESFTSKASQWSFFYTGAIGMLDISHHQNIVVLHSIVNTKTAMPCVTPYTLKIDFYWKNDVTLGRYIEQLIYNSQSPCPENCGSNLGEHYRTYVHGNAKIDVMVEKSLSRPPTIANTIFNWSYCKECGFTSPFTPLSDSSWKMSFGKFLELMFWSQRDSVTNLGTHSHDFAKDHIKFFTYNDLTIRMEYSKIDLLDIIPPKPKINWIPNTDIKLKLTLKQQVTEKCLNFFNSVSERLNRVKVDSISTDKMEAGQKRIEELKDRVTSEYDTTMLSIEEIYNTTEPIDHLPMNKVLRFVQDLSVEWDLEFQQFEQDYLPSEKDIARITALQLKKFFSDEREKAQGEGAEKETHTVQVETETLNPQEEGPPVSITTTTTIPVVTAAAATSTASVHGLQPNNPAASTDSSSSSPTPVPAPDSQNVSSAWTLQPSVPSISAVIEKDHIDDDTDQNEDDKTVDNDPRKPTTSTEFQPTSSARKVSDSSTSSETYFPKINSKGKVLEGIHKFEKLVSEQEKELKKSVSIGNIDLRPVAKLPIPPNSPLVLPKAPTSLNSVTPLVTPMITPKNAITPNLTPMKARMTPEQPKLLTAISPAFEKKESGYFDREAFSSKFVGPKFGLSTKELEIQLKEGRQKSFGSATSKGEDSKVSKLTNYFDHLDNISREFELAREMERLKLSHNRYRAAPVSTSRPIVEVFENVDDAFNEEAQKKSVMSKPSIAGFVPKSGFFTDESSDATVKDESNKIPQTEKVSLMKTLANFWADRSATLWKPLDYPLSSSEHAFADSDVIIHEDEPSSLIAFSLSTIDYNQKINDLNATDDYESNMTKTKSSHLKYQFNSAGASLSCKIFFAGQFDAFRRKCGLEDNFIQSLARCVKWDSTGGKSGSAFLKTLDDRLVMKQLSAAELESFVDFAPKYFEYMAKTLFHETPTTLAKIFGFYQIHIKNPITGKNFKMDVLIMENLFYGKKNLRIFDLKGSMRNRHVERTGKENEVLLDENMVEYTNESPLFVREFDKKLLSGSLWNDTLFLSKLNVMDYSLVIGIDDMNRTITVGIIDCIRTFTWDKKLESWVKEKGLVGGGGTKEPTIITPRQYKNRFREAMDRYFLMVPDTWFQSAK